MFQALSFLLKVALLAGAVLWFSRQPGTVEIHWMGYMIEASVGFAAAALAALLLAWTIVYRLWRAFVSVPAVFRRYRRAQLREKGYGAVTSGLVAIAAGDAGAAEKYARRAQGMIPDAPLARLLTAQAALLQGNAPRARAEFQALLENEQTAFFGLRGLLNDALAGKNMRDALTYIRQAEKLQPKRFWVVRTLFEMETRNRDWVKALATLKKAQKIGLFDAPTATRHRQAILCALAEESLRKGDRREALRTYRHAADLDVHFHPAVIGLGKTALAAGKRHLGTKYVIRGWSAAPHPDLADIWMKFKVPSRKSKSVYDEGRDGYSWMKQLYDFNPQNRESQRALGIAALDARLWREARTHLMQALDYRNLAKLERAETGNEAKAREWLEAATDNPPDPKWICGACGHVTLDWQALCRHCGAFNVYQWMIPSLDVREAPRKVAGLEPDLLTPPAF